ncbi:MAG: ATP-binding protein [Akkermansiaceae bacterium]|jgi:DNA transposition AAA+ family ATPase|nr:ATP-binding protein [Akkermansiaceae bacterium]
MQTDTATPTIEVDSTIVPDAESEQPQTITERQGDNARASWRMSGDHVQKALACCTPERKELLIWCFQWCITRGIWFQDFCKQVDYAENTVYKVLTGRHTDPKTGERYDIPEKLYQACLNFRKLEVKRAQLGETDFIITPMVRRVWTGCDLARESRTPVIIYGASHIGKTWALRQYTIANNHGRTVMVRVPAKAGLKGLIGELATAVGVSPKGDTPKMIARIKRALSPNHLVIFDEVHQLQYTYRQQSFFACIEVIREIYDAVECGMVLCTTNVFRTRFESAQKEELEQLFRRGVHRIQLGDIVRVEDLKPILAKAGLDWPTSKLTVDVEGIKDRPHEVLRQLAREGGLKAITERLRYARLIASRSTQILSWAHFLHAHLIIDTSAKAPDDDWS